MNPHSAYSSQIPMAVARVQLVDGLGDIGLAIVSAGWGDFYAAKNADDGYARQLLEASAAAKGQGLGIWAPGGLVRPSAEFPTDQAVLNLRESLAIVEGAHNGAIWVLRLLPSHRMIDFQIGGVKSPRSHPELDAREWVIRNMLHREIRVRIFGRSEGQPFIGSVQTMIGLGLLKLFEPASICANHR
jgi:hypothetical protein